MTEATQAGLVGHSLRVSCALPLVDGCSCGWAGDFWSDHILGLLIDAPLEHVSVEG
jgi:hypothetical protein